MMGFAPASVITCVALRYSRCHAGALVARPDTRTLVRKDFFYHDIQTERYQNMSILIRLYAMYICSIY